MLKKNKKWETILKIESTTNRTCFECNHLFSGQNNMLHQLAESLGSAIDAKDPYTSLHSEEVAEISFTIAMGFSQKDADIIHVAGHLHDIGKIGVPDNILQKRGPLSDEECSHIKKHPEMGASILKPVDCLIESGVTEMVLYHHERYDGGGYPEGLKGHKIPMGARIISLADALSAILQDRPYRLKQNFDEAVKEIERCSGTQFDPIVVKAFIKIKEVVRSYFYQINDFRVNSD
ncbi:MAG: HD-GYP domain-containing protein [Desulfobacterales bacterium]|nr:HD-GYP domain-containing protein [Desulfobacterales bacterium]